MAEVGHIGGQARARRNTASSSRRGSRVLGRIILGSEDAGIRKVENVRREGSLTRMPMDQDRAMRGSRVDGIEGWRTHALVRF